jgi:signal peptidase II
VSSDCSSEAALPAEGVLPEAALGEATIEEAPAVVPLRAAASSQAALRFFALVALTTVFADQLSKAWIRSWLPLNTGHEIIPGWLKFSHVLNEGAAWGMLAGQRWFLVAVTLIVMVVVSQMAREFAPHSRSARFGLGLILGGAVGNLIDRITAGAVTDFVDMQTSIEFIRTFPIFNVADSALTVGVILLILDVLLTRRLVTKE